ncbi:MAG TPA: ribosome biogenesis GTPase Der [Acidobacteriota bacterium]|nr:ribosome biogenesis GTPase Der [Acidobacteriota bacterium]
MSIPVVAIIGRPNVGKSSLFNRFLKKRLAVVDAESGVTRDRNYAACDWNGVKFRLIDTGGMVPDSKDAMERLILDQSEFAVHEADLVLLMVDVQTGLDEADRRLAQALLKAHKDNILVVNKADNDTFDSDVFGFVKLGLGDAYAVSATGGLGVGDLLDEVVRRIAGKKEEKPAEGVIRVAVVGRPNVGKSSFINTLLGENRLIVSGEAGTTRDAVDTPFELEGRQYCLIDTAGLRRSYKVQENIEFYTNLRATRAIEGCDVAVVLVDGSEGVTVQDQRILSQVLHCRRAAVLAVNKWDLVEKDSLTADRFTKDINRQLAKFAFLPIVYVSALSGQRLVRVMTVVDRVYQEFNRRIPTPLLNDFLQRVYARKKPPAKERKFIRFKYVTQTEVAPPTFVFFANHPQLVDKAYLQYLSNQLRLQYGFEGVPIRIKCRQK